jgi:hypothetical protein
VSEKSEGVEMVEKQSSWWGRLVFWFRNLFFKK